MSARPLLMIPGPVEISDAVAAAAAQRPPSHLAPSFIQAFGDALRAMREVWLAGPDHQPFVIPGSGTLAMESAVTNLMAPGDAAVVVDTGYFSARMAEMLRRRGVRTTVVSAPPGHVPARGEVETVLGNARALGGGGIKALFATHVDTSTGVRVDAQALAALAKRYDALSVFDGVCATAGERFEMAAWGADVYLTASQKALGVPPGLACWVASPDALAARAALDTPPPMAIDWQQWLPILHAYESGGRAYFSTPATSLVQALAVSLAELTADGMERRFALHQRAGDAMRAAWAALGLSLVPEDHATAANTLSAVYLPAGMDPSVVGRAAEHGAIIAGGLHPELKGRYFRVGHMGVSVTRDDDLLRTVRAVALALQDGGYHGDPEDASEAARRVLTGSSVRA